MKQFITIAANAEEAAAIYMKAFPGDMDFFREFIESDDRYSMTAKEVAEQIDLGRLALALMGDAGSGDTAVLFETEDGYGLEADSLTASEMQNILDMVA